jgi:hypothetical protein
MLFRNADELHSYLHEDMRILKDFAVKRIGLDPESVAGGRPLILMEFEQPHHREDTRLMMAAESILRQTVGPAASVLSFPFLEISAAILNRIKWIG